MEKLTTKVFKSGNSYAVRIPLSILRYLDVSAGDSIDIHHIKKTPPQKMTARMLALPLPLRQLLQALSIYRMKSAYVFGDFARNESTEQSILHILVDPYPDTPFSMLGELQKTLQRQAGIRVEIITRLNHRVVPYIEKELVPILKDGLEVLD